MEAERAAIIQTYTDYGHAFGTLNPRAILPYYHLPCVLISSQGVRVMATPEEVVALFTPMLEDLTARGYTRSELTEMHVKQMGERTALLSMSAVRYTTDGEELERLGATYTLHKTDDGWKIVVLTVHGPQTVLQLD